MARPTSFDRDAAIETAMQELWRHGYEACSVKAVSETLGITRSSYYNAFGSRENLFRLALAAYFEQAPDRPLKGEPPDMPVLAFITQVFRDICAVRARDPEARGCLAVNSLSELGGTRSDLADLLAQAVLSRVERLKETLDLAVRKGELPADCDTRATALSLKALMIGLNTLSKALPDEEALWLTAKTTLQGLGLYSEAAPVAPHSSDVKGRRSGKGE